jgi:hypothetical protein
MPEARDKREERKEREEEAPVERLTAPTEPGLDRMREILVGDQLRTLERRIAQTTERLGGEQGSFREEADKRLAGLEGKLRQEIEAIWKRLDAERRERTDALRELEDNLREQLLSERRERAEAVERLTQRLEEMHESLATRLAQLTTRQAQESQRADRQVEALAKLEEVVRDLKVTKVDRSAFATFLTEMTAGLLDGEKKKKADE